MTNQIKENTKFLTGNYAKQERAMSLTPIASLSTTKGKARPVLEVKKIINGLVHEFSSSQKPTYKDMHYFQAIISIAGNRLAKVGDKALVEKAYDNDVVRDLVNEMTDKDIELKKCYGYGSQIYIETSYYEILKKSGHHDGTNSRELLTQSLRRLGKIIHDVYNEGDESQVYNEMFLKHRYNKKTGVITIVINSFSSKALTSQFTLIDLSVKSYFLKNERALALYDFIVARVGHKEQQHFNMDRVIKIIEDKEEKEPIDKQTRNKYKKILLQLKDILPDWDIGTYGIGSKLVFNIDRGNQN